MKKVAIVTDSISTIPPEMAQEHDIKVIPLHIVLDGKDYLETQVDRAQLYARIERKENLPSTSSPSPGDYLEAYHELSQKAESIICITYSPAMGMAYKAANQAKDIAREKLPQTTIEVINSQTVCSGQLLLVLAAAKAAAEGRSLPEVIQVVNDMMPRICLMELTPSPKKLVEEGRATSKVGGSVEPRISTQSVMEQDASTGGVMTIFARVRTRAKGTEKLIEMVKDRSKGRKLHAAINYTTTPDDAQELKKRLLAQFQCGELYVTEDSLIPPIHEAVGAIKLGWYSED